MLRMPPRPRLRLPLVARRMLKLQQKLKPLPRKQQIRLRSSLLRMKRRQHARRPPRKRRKLRMLRRSKKKKRRPLKLR